MPQHHPCVEPTAPSDRLGSLDVLRGLALFGVLAINLDTSFRVSLFQLFLPGESNDGVDRAVEAGLKILIDFKALAVFSMLLGVGLAIQFDRLGRTGARTVVLVRRLVVLLAFGLIHLTPIWNGDILTLYALAGLAALPFLFAGNALIASGAVLLLGAYICNLFLPILTPLPGGTWVQDQVASAAHAYGSGGYADVLTQRLSELPGIFSLEAYVFPRTLGLMLLGILAWRMGVVSTAGERARTMMGCGSGLVLVGLTLTLNGSAREYFGWPNFGPDATMADQAGALSLALGYSALVLALCSSSRGARFVGWAGPVGRMAFSNYVAQSLMLGWVFYGYGLGLFNRLSPSQGLLLAVLLYAVQAVLSWLWLKRFRYGPLEWLWRTLTYGKAEAIGRTRAAEADAGA